MRILRRRNFPDPRYNLSTFYINAKRANKYKSFLSDFILVHISQIALIKSLNYRYNAYNIRRHELDRPSRWRTSHITYNPSNRASIISLQRNLQLSNGTETFPLLPTYTFFQRNKRARRPQNVSIQGGMPQRCSFYFFPFLTKSNDGRRGRRPTRGCGHGRERSLERLELYTILSASGTVKVYLGVKVVLPRRECRNASVVGLIMDESRSRRIPNSVSSRFVTPDDEKKRILRVSSLRLEQQEESGIVLPVDVFHPLLLFLANWFDYSIQSRNKICGNCFSFFLPFFFSIRFINKCTCYLVKKQKGRKNLTSV